jgi:hypothetical protein
MRTWSLEFYVGVSTTHSSRGRSEGGAIAVADLREELARYVRVCMNVVAPD